jgi:DNA gyrase/topoisomerase IV subunit B
MKGNIKEFVTDAFDYLDELETTSINYSVNRYLLEYIANGFVKYKTVDGFIKHIDDWIRSLVHVFPELGFNHDTNQINATIDLVDQVVVVDEALYEQLSYVINVQTKYGILIKFKSDSGEQTTTISRFFETINRMFPQIKDRYKGLGSSDSDVMAEVVLDPKTRRIYRVNIEDINRAKQQMGVLVGKNKEEVRQRKELLLDFKFTAADIDT